MKSKLRIMAVKCYGEFYYAEFYRERTCNRYELTTASRNRLDWLVEAHYDKITNVYLSRDCMEIEYQF